MAQDIVWELPDCDLLLFACRYQDIAFQCQHRYRFRMELQHLRLLLRHRNSRHKHNLTSLSPTSQQILIPAIQKRNSRKLPIRRRLQHHQLLMRIDIKNMYSLREEEHGNQLLIRRECDAHDLLVVGQVHYCCEFYL